MNETTEQPIDGVCISLVIPVYNVEHYLPVCVESILQQTYTTWEAILVDDGSTDGSGALCDQYAEQEPRVHTLHRKNGGVGAARNAGLAACTGEYIAFLDADDWLAPDFLEHLLADAVREQVPLVCCDCIEVINGKATPNGYHTVTKTRRVETAEELYRDFCRGKECYCDVVWGKLFHCSLLQNVQFSALPYAEDSVFMLHLLAAGPKVYCDCYKGYYYLRREASATGKGRANAAHMVEIKKVHLNKGRTLVQYTDRQSEEMQRIGANYYAQCVYSVIYWLTESGDYELFRQNRAMLCAEIEQVFRRRTLLSAKQRSRLQFYRKAPHLYWTLQAAKNRLTKRENSNCSSKEPE